MGQAKRRGTFEERKAQAIARQQSLLAPKEIANEKREPLPPAIHNSLLKQATVAGIMAHGLSKIK